jgi:hypothetical protein
MNSQQLTWSAGRAAIRDRKGTELNAMLGAKRALITQLELAHLRRLEQRHDDADICETPGFDLGAKILASARTRHQTEAMRIDASDPMNWRLEHGQGT